MKNVRIILILLITFICQLSTVNCQPLTTKDVIKDDFVVNDDKNGGCEQMFPRVAMDGAGNSIITWMDFRNDGWDIYAQKYDSVGAPQDTNFIVNDDDIANIQHFPRLAMNSAGRCVMVWTDFRDWLPNIYAQIYDPGVPQDSNFCLFDVPAFRIKNAIGIDGVGNFVVVLGVATEEEFHVAGQKFNASGIPIGDIFWVIDSSSAFQWETADINIAMNSSGHFVVVWDDYREGTADVYAQRFNSDCVPQGDNFRANQIWFSAQKMPSCGIDDAGNFVIVWMDSLSGKWEIFGQKYNADGTPDEGNFQINDIELEHLLPSVAMNGAGDFIVAWTEFRGWVSNPDYGGLDIYGQKYTSSGPQGDNFRLNDDSTDVRYFPSVTINNAGDFVATWIDIRTGNPDIYTQRFNSSCVPQGPNLCVNTDPPKSDQWDPCISMNSFGNFVTVWEDLRGSNPDIYAQRYDLSGTPKGVNFRVNWGREGNQYSPSVAISKNNKFIITWVDETEGDEKMLAPTFEPLDPPHCHSNRSKKSYLQNLETSLRPVDKLEKMIIPIIGAQRYNADGEPEGENFRVDDDDPPSIKGNPCVAVNNQCNFVIVWEDRREDNFDVYGQRYNYWNGPQGPNFRINDDASAITQLNPFVAVNSSGNFVVVWEDIRDGNFNIYGQRYNSSGVPQDSNFKINSDTESAEHYFPSVDMDSSGNFVVVWTDIRDGEPDIYGQRYNPSAVPQGGNFKINNDTPVADQWYPSVSMRPDGEFIVVWTDFANPDNPQIVAQRYLSDGTKWSTNVVINNPEPSQRKTWTQSVAVSPDIVGFAWMDKRRELGWDIYGKLTDWELMGIEENSRFTIHDSRFTIYPNPVHNKTQIHFTLLKERFVSLSVYDVSGRLVSNLISSKLKAGEHIFSWETKNFGAGIYFVKLDTGDKKITQKLVVLR